MPPPRRCATRYCQPRTPAYAGSRLTSARVSVGGEPRCPLSIQPTTTATPTTSCRPMKRATPTTALGMPQCRGRGCGGGSSSGGGGTTCSWSTVPGAGRPSSEAEPVQLSWITLPVLEHLDVEVQVYRAPEHRFDLPTRPAADLAQPASLPADHDRLLAGALDVDHRVDVDEILLVPAAHLLDGH